MEKNIKKEKLVKVPKVKKEKVTKPNIEVVTYEMKMVIPTGQYANIQPCIIVKGGSMQDAHDFIAPHMNKLWKEYFMVSERRTVNEPVKVPVSTAPVTPAPVVTSTASPSDIAPTSTVAYLKANQAISSCMSIEALDMIATQVEKSVKLDRKDKDLLVPIIKNKRDILNGEATTS
jgi:hypothetical protein